MIRIILHGCKGRMGRAIAEYLASVSDIEIVAGVDSGRSETILPFPTFTRLADCQTGADVIVDFSMPEALPALLEGAVRRKTPLVIGTTGYTGQDQALIREKAMLIPIFLAANLSIGVNLLCEIVEKAAAALGEGFDIEIVEKHHRWKKDAPSGTAYSLAEAANKVFLDSKNLIFGRRAVNQRRSERDIGVHAIRGGTLVGEHEVLFAGEDETLELRHTAYSRKVYAAGAIEAARYMVCKPAGLYTMRDMIIENSTVTNLYRSDDEALISINRVPDDPLSIARIFKRIGEENINLDMISQTAPVNEEVNISFTLPKKDVEKAAQLIRELQGTLPNFWLDVRKDTTKMTVEGVGMERQSGVAARIFEIMAASGIKIKAVTTSETKISYVIDQKEGDKAVNAIQQIFGV